MKRLFLFALICVAAWYGWKHYPEIMNHRPSHEAVVVNGTGLVLTRVRVTVGGQTFVKEELAVNDKVTFPFLVDHDSSFQLEWQFRDRMGTRNWSGGMVPKGPMVQRHTMTIDPDNEVIYQPTNK